MSIPNKSLADMTTKQLEKLCKTIECTDDFEQHLPREVLIDLILAMKKKRSLNPPKSFLSTIFGIGSPAHHALLDAMDPMDAIRWCTSSGENRQMCRDDGPYWLQRIKIDFPEVELAGELPTTAKAFQAYIDAAEDRAYYDKIQGNLHVKAIKSALKSSPIQLQRLLSLIFSYRKHSEIFLHGIQDVLDELRDEENENFTDEELYKHTIYKLIERVFLLKNRHSLREVQDMYFKYGLRAREVTYGTLIKYVRNDQLDVLQFLHEKFGKQIRSDVWLEVFYEAMQRSKTDIIDWTHTTFDVPKFNQIVTDGGSAKLIDSFIDIVRPETLSYDGWRWYIAHFNVSGEDGDTLDIKRLNEITHGKLARRILVSAAIFMDDSSDEPRDNSELLEFLANYLEMSTKAIKKSIKLYETENEMDNFEDSEFLSTETKTWFRNKVRVPEAEPERDMSEYLRSNR